MCSNIQCRSCETACNILHSHIYTLPSHERALPVTIVSIYEIGTTTKQLSSYFTLFINVFSLHFSSKTTNYQTTLLFTHTHYAYIYIYNLSSLHLHQATSLCSNAISYPIPILSLPPFQCPCHSPDLQLPLSSLSLLRLLSRTLITRVVLF